MTIDEDKRSTLIEYRLEQAKEMIKDTELLLVNNSYRSATNRIYYGMFYALLALALKYHFETSKHTQLLGWFNIKFISTGLIEVKYWKMLKNAYNNRTNADYANFAELSREDAVETFSDLKTFISTIEAFIEKE